MEKSYKKCCNFVRKYKKLYWFRKSASLSSSTLSLFLLFSSVTSQRYCTPNTPFTRQNLLVHYSSYIACFVKFHQMERVLGWLCVSQECDLKISCHWWKRNTPVLTVNLKGRRKLPLKMQNHQLPDSLILCRNRTVTDSENLLPIVVPLFHSSSYF